MKLLTRRLSTLETALWAAKCRQVQPGLEADLPTIEACYGSAAAAWIETYLEGLSAQEQAILAHPENWRRSPPTAASQRFLTAWHHWQAQHHGEPSDGEA